MVLDSLVCLVTCLDQTSLCCLIVARRLLGGPLGMWLCSARWSYVLRRVFELVFREFCLECLNFWVCFCFFVCLLVFFYIINCTSRIHKAGWKLGGIYAVGTRNKPYTQISLFLPIAVVIVAIII